jgi:pimeloyl-ACP methyl ester carboxylesterase
VSVSAQTSYIEAQIPSGEFVLRYIEAGVGEPLVWLHGGFGLHPSAGTDLLAASFRVVAVEMPGFGSSVEHDQARSFDELSEQVAEAIERIGLSRYLLHGTSFGAATALHLALNHPDRVTRLILESPAAFRPFGWTPPDLDTIRRGLMLHPERARRAQIEPDVQQRQREFVNRLSLTVDSDALKSRLYGLRVPTLVMFGEGDTLTPPDLAQLYCDNAPECSSFLVGDAAHAVSTDQPDVYAQTVREFAVTGERST